MTSNARMTETKSKETKMKTGQLICQGDVMLMRTTKAAITAQHKPVPADDHGRLVLAEGESSGHRHVFRDPGVCLLAREGVSDRVITVERMTELLHDEGADTYVPTGDHAPVVVPPGTYLVRVQREFDGEETRNAAD